ncbi:MULTISPECIES: hypothetical protein [Lactiplantibacillus]|uniref:Uncharacterized protein n=1 Tax=Lactiplantibacillus pentosus TaxID=1589 RepID=A0AAW8VW76_LACPE|nr:MULTISPECIES: hypothetical protein [Lactiplantibacillus]MBU7461967.1 hypothetical protein [Lactiplantibacillus pentosus]MBU7472633.1 hypothetical protein [Lactiplantibacillus pentosus]MBU7476517.1 hypothetical protein [Lactiplantibacillus pentosus]MBU7483283.1 hypothetical protein [Lactiplantibacillus sp. 30.2.29]MBU7486595.1 hypothetical protein [Lactiplantibacillus pentosus]
MSYKAGYGLWRAPAVYLPQLLLSAIVSTKMVGNLNQTEVTSHDDQTTFLQN